MEKASVWDPDRLYRISSIMGRCAPFLEEGDMIRVGIEGDPCFRGAADGDRKHEVGKVKWVRKHDDGLVEFGLEMGPDRSERVMTNHSIEPNECWEVHPSFVERFRGRAYEMNDDAKNSLFERVEAYATDVGNGAADDGERTEFTMARTYAAVPNNDEKGKSDARRYDKEPARKGHSDASPAGSGEDESDPRRYDKESPRTEKDDDEDAVAMGVAAGREESVSPLDARAKSDSDTERTRALVQNMEERLQKMEQQQQTFLAQKRLDSSPRLDELDQRLKSLATQFERLAGDTQMNVHQTNARVEACVSQCRSLDTRTVEKMRMIVLGLRHVCADIAGKTDQYSRMFVDHYDNREQRGFSLAYGKTKTQANEDRVPNELLYRDLFEDGEAE